MKGLKRYLSVILAAVMTIGGVSMTACAQSTTAAASGDDIVVPYKAIAKGSVNKKAHTVCDTVTDPEKGEVYRIRPNPETDDEGYISVDAWNLHTYKVDFNRYRTITIEYKLTSASAVKFTPAIGLGTNGGKALLKWKEVSANGSLLRDKWSKISFDIAPATKNNIGSEGLLWQLHVYPFGTALKNKSLKNGEEILISDITFSTKPAPEAPKEEVAVIQSEATITFDYNRVDLENPESVKTMTGAVIKLPAGTTHNGKTVTKWFCEADDSYYEVGANYPVSKEKVNFIAYWEDLTATTPIISINYSDYSGGICNRVDTATTETVVYEGKNAVKVTINPASEDGGAVNLDGWTYTGAKADVKKYNTAILIYKLLSEKPISGKARLNILKWQEFSKGHTADSRESLKSGAWAASSFDIVGAKDNVIEGKHSYITQMHIYPLGVDNKVTSMSQGDILYVADIIFLPQVTKGASYNASYIGGYDDGTFRPGDNMTRAEACTVISRIMYDGDANVPESTETSFSDVLAGDWFAKYVSACEKAGLLTSYSAQFNPQAKITRAEFVELVYKMGLLHDAGKNGEFTDVSAEHTRFSVISAAGKSGLVNGYANGDGTFSFKPDNTITRAEVVKVINNALGRKASIEAVKEGGYICPFTDLDETFWGYAEIISASTTHISYITINEKERWLPMTAAKDESNFNPNYEAAINKAAEVDALMVKRIDEIRNTPDTLAVTGKKVYVSNKGNDANDGLTPEKAVSSIEAAQKIAKAGDAILFERGGEWRANFTTIEGVSYGAYGTGKKPIINGNTTGDAADPSLWTLVEGTTNIYTFKEKLRDVGNIIYNGGALYTDKIVPKISENLELRTNHNNKKYDPKTSHEKNNTFFMVYDKIDSMTLSMPNTYGTLYVRCDEGNPGEVYDSIEIASYGHAIIAKSNNTFENLCILYAGGHGITAGTCKNLVIRNCEIGWIGGTSQYIDNGKNTRYGNGIQIYGGSDGFTIDNCYVYECYDAGISPQFSSGGTNEILLMNIFFTNNVIDKCIYNIEYFIGDVESGDNKRYFKTMYFTDNILARSGYGWGMSPTRSACIKGWDNYNKASDYVVKNNVILNPAYNAYHIGASFDGWLPELSDNTYIIRRNSQFVKYGANGSVQYTFDSSAEETAKNILLEKNFTLYYLPEDYKA